MRHDEYISAVVLAAGASRRMGKQDKLFLSLNGKSVLRRSVENALKADVKDVLVVAGENFHRVNLELKQLHVQVLLNRNHPLGISTSIITGVRALNPNTEAAVILLADQPNLQPQTINRLIETYRAGEHRIVVGRYHGIIGNPALFARDLFPELLQLYGDVGARSVLKRHSDALAVVDIPEEEALDVDTPEDLERLRRLLRNTPSRLSEIA